MLNTKRNLLTTAPHINSAAGLPLTARLPPTLPQGPPKRPLYWSALKETRGAAQRHRLTHSAPTPNRVLIEHSTR